MPVGGACDEPTDGTSITESSETENDESRVRPVEVRDLLLWIDLTPAPFTFARLVGQAETTRRWTDGAVRLPGDSWHRRGLGARDFIESKILRQARSFRGGIRARAQLRL